MSLRHNDPQALEDLLKRSRSHFQRAMVIVEGVYSMDGDIVALPEIVEVARRFNCLVMVDEAHSFGVLGDSGFGVREHYGMSGREVDIWMGTLSKSMSSYGGFLAGEADFCEALRMIAPGISMYAAAPPPPTMGAAVAPSTLWSPNQNVWLACDTTDLRCRTVSAPREWTPDSPRGRRWCLPSSAALGAP